MDPTPLVVAGHGTVDDTGSNPRRDPMAFAWSRPGGRSGLGGPPEPQSATDSVGGFVYQLGNRIDPVLASHPG
jgi:hypothetical protein